MGMLSRAELRLLLSRGRSLTALLGCFATCVLFAELFILNTLTVSAQSTKRIRFDVVSIRPTPTDADPYKGGGGGSSTDGYHMRIMPISVLIMNAYFPALDRTPNAIRNAPPWLTERFDVEAKVAPEDVPQWSDQTLSVAQRNEMVQGALQAMLVDRLKLATHREPVEVDGYALTVSRRGSKLKEITPDVPTSDRVMKMGDGAMGVWTATEGRNGYWTFYQTPMSQLRQFLQGNILKPIVDQTGLAGRYHFALKPREFGPDDHPAEDGSDRMDLDALGLELKPAKIKSSVLVIDHIEKLSEN